MRLENDSRGEAVNPMLDVKIRVMKFPSGNRANVWFVDTLAMKRGGSLKPSDAVTCSALPDQYEPVPTLALTVNRRRAALAAFDRNRVNRYSPGGRNTPGEISNGSNSRSYTGLKSRIACTLSPDRRCQSNSEM